MVLPEHWAEMPQHGIFMLACVVGQGLGVLLLPLADRPRWRWEHPAPIAGNLLILVIAPWAYTVGLPPWLYGDGVEAWNWQVTACDGLELALIVLCPWRWASPARSVGSERTG